MSNGFISDKGTIIGSDNSGNAIGFEETVGTACKNPNGYTVGSYFKGTDGNFYEVTATISSGATITVGTNCKKTDIATELSEINTEISELNAEIVDQTPETDITISVCATGLQISTNQGFRVGVQLPFIMKNTNYVWKSSNLTMAGYGTVVKNGDIIKFNNSLVFMTDYTSANAPEVCFVFGTITLTFKAD